MPRTVNWPLVWRLTKRIAAVSFVLPFLSGAVTYVVEVPSREKQANYAAWQIVNGAQLQGASGGRIEALEDLNEHRCWLGSLACFHHRVDLSKLSAPDSTLDGVSLVAASLDEANLKGAHLQHAHFDNASLVEADVTGGRLAKATFKCAQLMGTHFDDADMRGADFEDAQFGVSDDELARLRYQLILPAIRDGYKVKPSATFKNADLRGARFRGAWLAGVDFTGANVASADFTGARGLTPEQLATAVNWNPPASVQSVFAPERGTLDAFESACPGLGHDDFKVQLLRLETASPEIAFVSLAYEAPASETLRSHLDVGPFSARPEASQARLRELEASVADRELGVP